MTKNQLSIKIIVIDTSKLCKAVRNAINQECLQADE